MEIDVAALKRTIASKNTTLDAVAGILGIDRSTLYRKLRGDARGITLKEAQKISDYLELDICETIRIFWKRNGTDMQKRA